MVFSRPVNMLLYRECFLVWFSPICLNVLFLLVLFGSKLPKSLPIANVLKLPPHIHLEPPVLRSSHCSTPETL